MASVLEVSGRHAEATGTKPVPPPRVSVVIPARDEEHSIAACLCALRQQTVAPKCIEVIVVAAGSDRTAEVADREGAGYFGRFEVVTLETGNKNAALRRGWGRARGEVVVLLDADTELAPDALAELLQAVQRHPNTAAHGAMVPRVATRVSRYCELNRKLVKDLRFDGHLSGGVVALPRAAVRPDDLPDLFPDRVGPADDFQLTLALRRRGWRIAYAPKAVATTLFPWTVRGLCVSLLRNRRGVMAALPLYEATLQAGKSALLLLALPAAAVMAPRSIGLAVVCLTPLLVHIVALSWRVATLRRRGLGDDRDALPLFILLDLLGRSLKLWAFVERLAGRRVSPTFRGERPEGARPPREA